MLETMDHESSVFLTLTYDEDHFPENGSLNPRDLQLFVKRLRKRYAPNRFRFYAVGEYGDKTERPHYHLALFGFPFCAYLNTRKASSCCKVCDMVRETWGFGHVFLGTLEQSSARYICRYVLKKMTNPEDLRLNGRHPEFARMSNRPGIGLHAMDEVANTILKHGLDKTLEDVPNSIRIGEKEWPLGHYLKQQLRRRIGRDAKAPECTIETQRARLCSLYLDSWDCEVGFFSEKAFAKKIVAKNKQARLNQGARVKLRRKARI